MPNIRISREVDGERIEGVTRPVFIRNGKDYFLTDLEIYADGSIFCWEWVDLAGLKAKLASGWVATSFEAGARASAHHLASWQFADPQSWMKPEWLLGEVADEIDKLNERPGSTGRCLLALDHYLQSRSEEDRAALRAAYEAIPEHLRRYALGDMDSKDWPLRVLAAGKGGRLDYPDGNAVTVTGQTHQQALDYFADRQQEREKWERRTYPDGPEGADSPTVHLNQVFYSKGWPEDPGVLALRNEYPAAVVIDSVSYPTIVHAYWALAATDPATAEQIRAADRPYDARTLAEQATIRPDWPVIRIAVMARLLRAKFAQHPELAEILLATGDGRIEHTGFGSSYWNAERGQGRNWMGRLLELIRSEIAAQRASSPAQPAP
ncbi:MAG TPA: NADAR family protein [Streptosporangiaceae bacterium]|nr:NADAR family protein [Streptosporangiaceae bacterium]HVB44684.1 NADAR family protein [Streptosporangiaceae bacterium]